ncbi:MAG TPA: TlpA disulfide reductase family protein [Pyrinomonadaceae bacterium]|nr:TlpA disulfide reductase family protein [Pyrinomonadaceae bacterium]
MRPDNSRRALTFCALLLVLTLAGRQAAFAQAAPPKQNAEKAPPATALKPLEIDIDGLRKILRRDRAQPSRPLLLNFWATWCDPCREEFPDLLKVEADYRQRGLEFVAVSFDFAEDVEKAVPEFLRGVKADLTPYWLNLPDPEPAIRMVDPAWTGGIPTTFLFDAQGKLVFKHTGRVKATELREAIDKVLDPGL